MNPHQPLLPRVVLCSLIANGFLPAEAAVYHYAPPIIGDWSYQWSDCSGAKAGFTSDETAIND